MRSIAARLAVPMVVIAHALAAQGTDIIRGRVTGPDTTSLRDVNVRATSFLGGVVKTAMTDRNGRYTVIVLNGEGDYWLDFTKIGFAAKRFEVRKIGDEEVLIADARMTEAVQTLGAVEVREQSNRSLPSRNGAAADVGGGEKPLTNNNVAMDQAGNLAAMAAAVAGVQLIPGLDGAADMYSLLGLSGDQNNATFNGLGSSINALPPDILATTSIRPYSFDPANGGFSGAQIAIQTLPGSNFSRRAVTSVNVAPPLEWTDATSSALDQKYTNLRIGGNAAGPIALDQAFYNVAYNIGTRFNDARTLLNASAPGLVAAGVSSDSVSRLLSILGREGLPATFGGVPAMQTQTVVQSSANFDWMPSTSGTGHSFTLGGAGNLQRTDPVSRGGLLLATPAHGGEARLWAGNASLVHSNYFGFGVLSKTTAGFAGSATSTTPYAQLPEGTVRVASQLSDGNSSIKPLSFGGNASPSSLDNRTTQLSNQLSWFSADNHHTLKLASLLSYDTFSSDATPSLLGTFTFNSLQELADGRPSSFARTLSHQEQSGSQLSGALSIGDYWRPSTTVQVQYGARIDANRFLSTPSFNPAVESALGVRNDVVPDRAYVSPRIGLQWTYGTAPQVAYAPGAARPPLAVIHAGVGVFQNMASSQLIASEVATTGLANSTRSVSCVGGVVPTPDWTSFVADPATIPTQCTDGSTGSAFATSAPNVSLVDPRYRQPRSVRAAADWSSPVLDNRFVLGLQSILSFGGAQPGLVDINFDSTVRLRLANEANRPVFADPAAIVPNTGAMSLAATRISSAFQQVLSQRSDLHVDSRQLTVNLKPVAANPYLKWDLSYSLLDARESYYGFSSTAGNPYDQGSGRSLLAPRHSVLLEWWDVPIFDVVYVTAAARFSSGQYYTPMIAGDINGDGAANDRAFVFDPVSSDSATATSMRALLTNGTGAARDCLERQLGRLAARGSCRAPWVANAYMQIKFNPEKIGLPKRATITLGIQNPLGIADLALHGSNDMHGWGQNIAPDQNLLFVRGFDPTTQRFKYDVNQRFGSTRPQQTITQALPFISLGVKIDIGVPRERQTLTQRLDLGRGRAGAKQSPEALKQMAIASIPNPMTMILQQGDSLHLTRKQADSIALLSHMFSVLADSTWTPVANHFAGLPNAYSRGEAYERYVAARERTMDYLIALVPSVKGVLTSAQRRRLPLLIANYLDERVLRYLRSSTGGDNSSIGGR